MSEHYRAISWTPQKRTYDLVIALGVALHLVLFVGIGLLTHSEATIETLLIRAFGVGALVLLHVILVIGPLARLDARFLPLLYNRRHLGVTMFALGLVHGGFAILQFHSFGDLNPLVSVLVSNPRWDSFAEFPFQPLGLAALGILFLMAATSHDFWLKNLTAPTWKALHMLVYIAYALIVMHVSLGTLQAEVHPVNAALLLVGALAIGTLHVVAGARGRELDEARDGDDAAWVDVCRVDDLEEARARIVTLGGERVAVFRWDGKVSALSNVCQHQNGPLGEGRVIDGLVTCPWHGYQYRPDCGRSPEPFTERVPTFRVRVVDGVVAVDPRALPAGTAVEPALAGGTAETRDAARDTAETRDAAGDTAEMRDAARDEFYIGWLPRAPARLARRLRGVAALLVLSVAAVASSVALVQRPFASSRFEYGVVREFEGTIDRDPVPHLRVARPGGDSTSRWLLVAPFKHGASELIDGYDGARVRLRGTLIHRDDVTMIEVVPGSILASDVARPSAPEAPVELGELTLAGEIVDSKCFLGVMKPGELKPHRACASLCIRGGIPPVLCERDADGDATYWLLVGPGGEAVNEAVLPFVA